MKKLLFLTPFFLAFTGTLWCSSENKDRKDVKAQATRAITMPELLTHETGLPESLCKIIHAYTVDGATIKPFLTQHRPRSVLLEQFDNPTLAFGNATQELIQHVQTTPPTKINFPTARGSLPLARHTTIKWDLFDRWTYAVTIRSHLSVPSTIPAHEAAALSSEEKENYQALVTQKKREYEDLLNAFPAHMLSTMAQLIDGHITMQQFKKLAILPANATQEQQDALKFLKANFPEKTLYIKFYKPLIVGSVVIVMCAIIIGSAL